MSRSAAVGRLAALTAIVAVGFFLLRLTPAGRVLWEEGAMGTIAYLRSSTWAPVVFVTLYAAATAFAIPGTLLTLAGGAVFGFGWGLVLNSIGANLGANAAFLLARSLGRSGIEGLLQGKNVGKHLARLDEVSKSHGFRGLFILRLIPVVPFNALNFGSGLTAITWRDYAGATLFGILPGTAVYTLFADALLQGSQEASRAAFLRVLLAGALLAGLSLLPIILRKMRVEIPGGKLPIVALTAVTLGGFGAPGFGGTPVHAQEIPDHATFDSVLAQVVELPLVDYRALTASRRDIDAYVDELARTDPSALERAPNEVRLAFWINAYNACMLKLVADHYPLRRADAGFVGSIRNLFAGYPSNSVWSIPRVFTDEHCEVAGELRSQDEIEHEIIRREFVEPRIHFAVNCAARSCPVLWPEAYHPDELDRQLERAVTYFVESTEHFRIDDGPPAILELNKVMDWYQEDFGGLEGLRSFFGGYVSVQDRARLLDPTTELRFFDYDWTLNDVER